MPNPRNGAGNTGSGAARQPRTKPDPQLAKLLADSAGLRTDVDATNEAVVRISHRVAVHDDAIDTLRTTTDGHGRRLGVVEDHVTDLDHEVVALRGNVEILGDDVNDLRAISGNLVTAVQGTNDNLASLGTTVGTLATTVGEHGTAITGLRTDVDTLKKGANEAWHHALAAAFGVVGAFLGFRFGQWRTGPKPTGNGVTPQAFAEQMKGWKHTLHPNEWGFLVLGFALVYVIVLGIAALAARLSGHKSKSSSSSGSAPSGPSGWERLTGWFGFGPESKKAKAERAAASTPAPNPGGAPTTVMPAIPTTSAPSRTTP